MEYCLSRSSYHSPASEYIFQGVARRTEQPYLFCFGVIAPHLPSLLQRRQAALTIRHFADVEFVTSEGIVTSSPQEGALPLKGLLVAWVPSSPTVLQDVLCHYVDAVCSASGQEPQPAHCFGTREVGVEQVAQALRGKRALLFTGAGISVEAGLPNLEELMGLTRGIFEPLGAYVHDLVVHTLEPRVAQVDRYWALFTASQPTTAHWLIADLCQTYSYPVVTGNLDGLHEKTGIQPLFYGGRGTEGLPDLSGFEYLLTIGVAAGIGEVAAAYHAQNPQGTLIAINPEFPTYCGGRDWHIRGEAAPMLEQLVRLMQTG